MKDKARIPLDYAEYEADCGPFRTLYGLPEEVTFCKKCVVSNQRPNSAIEYKHTIESKKETIFLDSESVCDACRYCEKKRSDIDWEQRERELRELCDRFRRDDGYYDCLVPGSGGKDSYYAAHVLKYRYGMHPLTVTWAPHLYTDWGWKNLQAWIHSGFDNILITPNGRVHRLLTRLAVENIFHPFQPFIIGQKTLPPKIAVRYKIPLIFYGENEAEYGNAIQTAETALQDWRYYALEEDESKIYIAGTSFLDLKEFYGIDDNDLHMYLPANPEELRALDVQVHYLGYYLKWHPQRNYYYCVEHGDFEASPERTPGTYSKYSSIDDKMDDLHYYTTFIKFGIARTTEEASQEIRAGDLTREEGVALVERFDGEYPRRFLEELFAYLSMDPEVFPEAARMFKEPRMDEEYFLHLAERFRSPHLWRYRGGQWELRHRVWDEKWSSGICQEDQAMTWKGNVY